MPRYRRRLPYFENTLLVHRSFKIGMIPPPLRTVLDGFWVAFNDRVPPGWVWIILERGGTRMFCVENNDG